METEMGDLPDIPIDGGADIGEISDAPVDGGTDVGDAPVDAVADIGEVADAPVDGGTDIGEIADAPVDGAVDPGDAPGVDSESAPVAEEESAPLTDVDAAPGASAAAAGAFAAAGGGGGNGGGNGSNGKQTEWDDTGRDPSADPLPRYGPGQEAWDREADAIEANTRRVNAEQGTLENDRQRLLDEMYAPSQSSSDINGDVPQEQAGVVDGSAEEEPTADVDGEASPTIGGEVSSSGASEQSDTPTQSNTPTQDAPPGIPWADKRAILQRIDEGLPITKEDLHQLNQPISDLQTGTLEEDRSWVGQLLESERYRQAMSDSQEAESLSDAVLAALKARNYSRSKS